MLVLLALAVAVQLVVLYAPEGGGPPLFPHADKVVHLLVFLVPVALALLAGLPPRGRRGASSRRRPCSARWSRRVLLPHRSGDVLDVVADLTGVALGVLVGRRCVRSRAGSRGAARSGPAELRPRATASGAWSGGCRAAGRLGGPPRCSDAWPRPP